MAYEKLTVWKGEKGYRQVFDGVRVEKPKKYEAFNGQVFINCYRDKDLIGQIRISADLLERIAKDAKAVLK